ncbi:hypothetical protein HYN49_12050 [Flavobacterium pallidum]|uniref:Uncharacterized protein n=1 Tax=Flavobacterium pallidum TaxID=2172098 RepID=A0A2S1SLR1_9FLAO|nr:hypothetical protein HYN49_12050 [Flavobacterium pallidum]
MKRRIKRSRKNSKRKNRLGVKNSLVNNINARRRKGVARSKRKSHISKKAYKAMRENWKK